MRNGFMHNPFIGEFMGTLVLVLRGNGVVANVSLNKSKALTKYGPRPAAGPSRKRASRRWPRCQAPGRESQSARPEYSRPHSGLRARYLNRRASVREEM